ncbi:cell division topological specificity factor MinE [Gudongella oleilytica]|uniref:cell division topological specificity factor MinE n=1 Tax=Gudongella oleilytica TaxID=1582259 RepID=UPI0019D26210|nr:cell division topological specificity factor MinE [Gudongella oleilytica]MDY0255588.1 cell division topological specificity factor MinE [Gudongella oleilytica]HMM69034.1 cell division topological specificity factor MinE [Gudongella oleilytica]
MDFFKMFTKKQEKSKNVAKERLKLVLVHDRADLSPRFLEMIKTDIVKVISQYAEIDEAEIDIKMTKMKKDGNSSPVSALVANIPIVKVKEKKK